ncbi:hypothetical protein GCM10010218_46260 [Streptomyces mashuensis]|uniref:Erythromycin esterase n=1 Tax=Streptomyces mashuensis TaxID=33904 RepID=A0A919EEQ5_9ACTN|nr:erythromycin esterase family protein [Streptomyces mashuensis]GHF59479.1 hypothetical protein GCM10010218_46260 [Streptomyces mashuensis]
MADTRRPHRPRTRRTVLSLVLLLCTGALAAVAPHPGTGDDPVTALAGAAHPLRTADPAGDLDDLRPLGAMVGDATVVGVGEATHSSHEFFTGKHRLLRHLVEEKGFSTFALEVPWTTGLRLDAYVTRGEGDPEQIMAEEFQRDYAFWNTQEYLDLVQWMRNWNTHHTRALRFMGDDIGNAGPQSFDGVTGYLRAHHPGLLPRVTALYRGLRPAPGTGAADRMTALLHRPPAERRELAARAREALGLLQALPEDGDRDARAWAVQHARTISQTADEYAFDLEDETGVTRAMRHRDEQMAVNVAWWQRTTGSKILLSAHNGHVSYSSTDPRYPRVQGAFLRDLLGRSYVSVRQTFGAGSFNATTDAAGTKVEARTVGPAEPGTNERTLDRAGERAGAPDYVVDLRTVPEPARSWAGTARPSREFGTAYPDPPRKVALADATDILVHRHRVTAARLFPAGKAVR